MTKHYSTNCVGKLGKNERSVLQFIKLVRLIHGYTPTLESIAMHCGLSVKLTSTTLRALDRKGWIRRPKYSRTIEIVE